MGNSLCNLLQIALVMFQTHVDTPANQAKINEVLEESKKECIAYQESVKKKEPKSDSSPQKK